MKKFNELCVVGNQFPLVQFNLSERNANFVVYLISMINSDDEDFKTYRFYLSDYCSFYENMTGRKDLKSELVNDLIKLSKTQINVIRETERFIKQEYFNWFSYLSISKDKEEVSNGEIIECRFDSALKPLLLKLKKEFFKFNMVDFLMIESRYTKQIFLLASSILDFENGRLIKFGDLKSILNIPNNYQFFNVNQKILKPAISELKKFNIDLSYKFEKKGKKVVAVKFIAKSIKKDKVIDVKSDINLGQSSYSIVNDDDNINKPALEKNVNLFNDDIVYLDKIYKRWINVNGSKYRVENILNEKDRYTLELLDVNGNLESNIVDIDYIKNISVVS